MRVGRGRNSHTATDLDRGHGFAELQCRAVGGRRELLAGLHSGLVGCNTLLLLPQVVAKLRQTLNELQHQRFTIRCDKIATAFSHSSNDLPNLGCDDFPLLVFSSGRTLPTPAGQLLHCLHV